jgi:hypothetical protein
VAWLSWLGGSCLGAVLLFPWIYYLITERPGRPVPSLAWWELFNYWVCWTSDPFGLDLRYSLGKYFAEFLTYPIIDGRPTHLVMALHVLLIVIWAVSLVRLAYLLWHDRQHLADRWIGRSSPTAFTLSAALWGYGILLTLSLVSVTRHYLIILFPLEFVWLARLTLAGSEQSAGVRRLGRGVLVTLCVAQLLISASFLNYIHVNQGAPDADYGVAYGAQSKPADSSP